MALAATRDDTRPGLAGRVMARYRAAARTLSPILTIAPLLILVLAGFERRWMDDDAFINLRIVRNWLHGDGLLFNLDERVEAGTSPLWLAFVALLGRFGLRLEHAAVFGGIALTGLALLFGQDGAARLLGPRTSRLRGATRGWLPLGAVLFAALPPAWDYASSGLETGLVLAWLAASYDVSARRIAAATVTLASMPRLSAEAMLIGLGPLIRPELAIYCVALFVPWCRAGIAGKDRRSGVVAVAGLLACAGAFPFAYQVFRMAYFASVVPNPALAKEAFAPYVSQGGCYFKNFFGTYRLVWPLSAAGVVWLVYLVGHWIERRRLAIAASASLVVAAAVHVAYLVVIGGDYMHGRLLVPAVFAVLLPVMMVPVPAQPRRFPRALVWTCSALVAVWAFVCGAKLRVGTENECGIGDERGWYARVAGEKNPVSIESYRGHFFFESSRKALDQMQKEAEAAHGPASRRVYLDDDQLKAPLASVPSSAPISHDIDSRVSAVRTAGAIGIFGYLAPATVHVVDLHGLADPLVSHFELQKRGRPGHEKRLSVAWLLARFSEPASDEDSSVTAARRALHCGQLALLEHAVSGPLTFRTLIDNVKNAWAYSHLRIPLDPFDAEVRFCNTPQMPHPSTGGDGGIAFRWRCPGGWSLRGLRGTFKSEDLAIATVQPACRANHEDTGDGRGEILGPTLGEASTGSFEVACPKDAVVTGIYGWSDSLLRSVGVLCSGDAAVQRTSRGGVDRGREFALSCPGESAVIGIEGRSGALVDALGILCPAPIETP